MALPMYIVNNRTPDFYQQQHNIKETAPATFLFHRRVSYITKNSIAKTETKALLLQSFITIFCEMKRKPVMPNGFKYSWKKKQHST